MKELGVTRIFGPSAAGSLRRDIPPRTFVVCDQAIDVTKSRDTTFYDGPVTTHISFADPYCPVLRQSLVDAAVDQGIEHRVGGTMVVIEGPRFSTRAESRWYAALGGTLINMTGAPEAALARELRLCYAALALVTDMDAGVEAGSGVGQAEVFARFRENLERLTGLLAAAVAALPDPAGCTCSTWADGIELTYELP
jgi:5'-methylthioadenosine phosphorylase